MSEISSVYSSTSRITGIYSELDTDAIVEDLLEVEQTKIDRKDQEKTSEEWYYDALGNVQELVEDFQSAYLSALGESSMLSSDTYKSYSVSMDDTSAVSVATTSSALTGSYTIDSITQLAQNASVSSSGISADGSNISESNTTALEDLCFLNELEFDGNNQISFSINGSEFTFDADTTLQTMINTVNADEDAGVTMKYSRLTDGFTITADAGGASSSVTIENISGNAFGADGAFGIGEGTTGLAGFGTEGQNAVCSIEGVTVTRDSNEFTIDGITYALNKTTDEAVDFTVERDFSSTIEAIGTFIDAYNELTEKLNDLLDEKDYSSDYKPLTSSQENEMSESEVEKWNEKAMSGLLRNNSDLESFLSNIQSAFFTSLGGTSSTMASIGITTAGYFSDDAGKILVDEDKLAAALEKNPETVISMFTGSEDDAEGLIYKISNSVNSYLDKLDDDQESSAEEIDTLENKTEEMEDSLDDMAERYYNKFAVMEEALSKLNSMSSMLSTLLSG
jgi:flagellar hook-associated protein 2